MGEIGGTDKHLAFADFHHFARRPVRLEVQLDIALDLIEELLARFKMEIEPRVRSRQHHHDEFGMVRDDAVRPERWIELLPVLGDPGFQVCGRKQHVFTSAAAGAFGVIYPYTRINDAIQDRGSRMRYSFAKLARFLLPGA